MLIVFEGIDGCGKSTQLTMLANALRTKNYSVVQSKEPTDGLIGRKARATSHSGRLSPKDEYKLFIQDRRQHVKELILPSLNKGHIVLLDRYYFSTMAYQGSRGIDPNIIRTENESFAPKPNIILLFQLPIETALSRITSRDGSANAFEKEQNLLACHKIFSSLKDPQIRHIDAQRTPEQIHQQILKHITPLLPSTTSTNNSKSPPLSS